MYDFKDKNIGIAFTGSYCTYEKAFIAFSELQNTGANIYTIFSNNAASTNSRFGTSTQFLTKAEKFSGKKPILTIPEAEPIGPKSMLDILVIMPCTGNTLAKLANGITDTPVLMAAKSHLRTGKPVLIALSTNDALGMNLKNIGILLNTKSIYFVPFGQDNHITKPNSMIAHLDMLLESIECALCGRQLQPVIVSPFNKSIN